jgi:hypothetical protein
MMDGQKKQQKPVMWEVMIHKSLHSSITAWKNYFYVRAKK